MERILSSRSHVSPKRVSSVSEKLGYVGVPPKSAARFAAICLVGLLACHLAAADTVIYHTDKDNASRASLTGTISDFAGGRLTIRNDAGTTQVIPAERIVVIHSQWTAAEAAGDRCSQDGELAAAVSQYQQALQEEKRVWVQRQIVAKLVGVYGQLEQFELAGEAFLRLLQNDPQTSHAAVIPLSWTTFSPSPTFQQRASAWLADKDNSLASLLGASWLLSTSQRAAALAALQRLQSAPDSRVAMLAHTQLWRTRIPMTTPEEIEAWERWLERMPADLRGGPCYVIGQAWSAKGRAERSAWAFLRVPILYPADRRLVALALLSAGRELEKIGQRAEAVSLYRELVRDHATAPAVAEARGRLEELDL